MSKTSKNALLWTISIVVTLLAVYYQRATGPTHPKYGTVTVDGQETDYKLLRSHGGKGGAPVTIAVPDTSVSGILSFRRYKSNDQWIKTLMIRKGDTLTDTLPHLAPAGKMMYTIELKKNGKLYPVTREPVILRYKGAVPVFVLVPHILFMFFVMLFGVRAAIEALAGGEETRFYTGFTMVCLFIGGLILGPVVQKYAFGVFWSGWPFGHDLTDNKTIFVFIFWLIAWYQLKKNELHKTWVIIAAIVMLVVYSIPHSAMGSEIDYTKQKTEIKK